MAEEPQSAEVVVEGPKKKGLPKKTLGIVAGVAILQGVGFLVVFKMMGGSPEPAHGDQNPVIEPAASQPVQGAEVRLLKSFKVPNDRAGVLRIYDIDLSIVIPIDRKEEVEQLVAERSASIADRVARIVRGATEQMLRETDLRALRDQLEMGIEEIIGDEDLVQRVLIPKFVPIRAQ